MARPKTKRSTADLASLLLAIGQATLEAVEDSGLLVRPKAKRKTTGKRRKRRTKAEMAEAAKPKRAPKPKAPRQRDEDERRDDIEDED